MSGNGATRVDVASEGAFHLKLAIELAMKYHLQYVNQKEPTIKQWALIDNVVYCGWHESMGGQPMIVPHTAEMMVPVILALLDSLEYPEEPDTDGSASRGWRLRSGMRQTPKAAGIDDFYAQFTIEPEWMEYGK
jgi:hypothetical protein